MIGAQNQWSILILLHFVIKQDILILKIGENYKELQSQNTHIQLLK